MPDSDPPSKRSPLRELIRGSAMGLGIGGALVAADFLDHGFGFGTWGPLLLAMSIALSAVTTVIAPLVWVVKRFPEIGEILGCCVCVLAIGLPTMRHGITLRREALVAFAARSHSVTDAIERFSAAEGRPPRSLEELVPQSFAEHPRTGLDAYPSFQYRLKGEAGLIESPWELSVETHWGLSFARMFYWPSHAYPEQTYGGRVERIGKWAYVHE